jgi:hypothetical protein
MSGPNVSGPNVLLTPGRIGAVEIRNRIVMAPMTTRLADESGFVTESVIDYYMARARRRRSRHRRNGVADPRRPSPPPRAWHP